MRGNASESEGLGGGGFAGTLSDCRLVCALSPQEDEDARAAVLESLLRDGVRLKFNLKFLRVETEPPAEEGGFSLTRVVVEEDGQETVSSSFPACQSPPPPLSAILIDGLGNPSRRRGWHIGCSHEIPLAWRPAAR